MKRLLLFISIPLLSFNVFGERIPNWVRNGPRYDKATGGYDVVGSSIAMSDNGIERHLAAVYFALENYSYAVDSVISNSVSRIEGDKTEVIIEQLCSCSIDYVIKKNTY